jgi:IPT/TIG domain
MTKTMTLRTEEEILAQMGTNYNQIPIHAAVTPAATGAPTVTAVSPASGTTAGGTGITITGTNFSGVTAVKIGGTSATSIVVASTTRITAVAPAHTAGQVSVTVTNNRGTNASNTLYTYTAPSAGGGNTVTRVGPTICIKNQTTVLTDAQVQNAVNALQIQLDRDWQPAWGTTATLVFASANQSVPTGAWPIYMLDTSDVSGALGYHDETAGRIPYGRVFAKDDMLYGYNWTVTLSHELLEMMLDPYVNQTVFAQTDTAAGLLYAYEACDAVEADSLGYSINGVTVSDFVYPAWFDITITNYSGVKFDHMNHLSQPFQLWSGGYIGVFPVPNNGSGWNSINAQRVIGPADNDADDSHGSACCTSCIRDRRSR